MAKDIQVQRRTAAWAWVGAGSILLAIVLIACAYGKANAEANEAEGVACSQRVTENILSGASLADSLEDAGFQVLEPNELPAWFIDEVLESEFVEKAFVDEEFETFLVCTKETSGKRGLVNLFAEKGWINTSDNETVMSLIKKGGQCRWMTVIAGGRDERDLTMRIQHNSPSKEHLNEAGDGS